MPNAPRCHRPAGGTARREYDQRRGTASDRGYNWDWTKHKKSRMSAMVLERMDPFCVYCNRQPATLLDHANPPSRQGPLGSAAYQKWFDDERYLVPACRDCNTRKGNKLPVELKRDEPEMYRRLVAFLGTRGIVP